MERSRQVPDMGDFEKSRDRGARQGRRHHHRRTEPGHGGERQSVDGDSVVRGGGRQGDARCARRQRRRRLGAADAANFGRCPSAAWAGRARVGCHPGRRRILSRARGDGVDALRLTRARRRAYRHVDHDAMLSSVPGRRLFGGVPPADLGLRRARRTPFDARRGVFERRLHSSKARCTGRGHRRAANVATSASLRAPQIAWPSCWGTKKVGGNSPVVWRRWPRCAR